jgi:hypothetical protein
LKLVHTKTAGIHKKKAEKEAAGIDVHIFRLSDRNDRCQVEFL